LYRGIAIPVSNALGALWDNARTAITASKALGAHCDNRTANTSSKALGALFATETATNVSKALTALAVALRDIRRT